MLLLAFISILFVAIGIVWLYPIYQVSKRSPKEIYERIKTLPLGDKQMFRDYFFIFILYLFAPYSANVYPKVIEMSEKKAIIEVQERYSLRNPFQSVHLAALINAAEFASA